MKPIAFELTNWFPPDGGGDLGQTTAGGLRIRVGDHVVTEVFDRQSRGTRDHVRVPLVELAYWLVLNWWRLRWESGPVRAPTSDWLLAHRLSAIGGDHIWPALNFSSDGDFVRAQMAAEPLRRGAAIRFLNAVDEQLEAREYERAVDDFLDLVLNRLDNVGAEDAAHLRELRDELQEERTDPELRDGCVLQAIVGRHPGDAHDGWLADARNVVHAFGMGATTELLRAQGEDLGALRAQVAELKGSPSSVVLPDFGFPETHRSELPWQRGARMAEHVRTKLGWAVGPVSSKQLAELLSVPALPLPKSSFARQRVQGGYRTHGQARTPVGVPSERLDNQRFYLARLLSAPASVQPSDRVLPITSAESASQKVQRSFAQELLCPWAALDAFTDEEGLDEYAITRAAERFEVSELCIRSTLVNRHKVGRDYLPMDA